MNFGLRADKAKPTAEEEATVLPFFPIQSIDYDFNMTHESTTGSARAALESNVEVGNQINVFYRLVPPLNPDLMDEFERTAATEEVKERYIAREENKMDEK